MMKPIYPILAFLLAACIAPASADPTTECYMTPLDEFANSPRRFRNDDGSEVVSSSLVKLGPGIVASRQSGAPGQTTFATLDAPAVASQAAQIAALEARVAALEAFFPDGDTIEVRRIIAKGTGSPPDINIADLQIVTKTVVPNSYDEVIKIVGKNQADITPSTKIGFFSGTANPKQTLPPGYVLGDVVSRFENYNLLEELP